MKAQKKEVVRELRAIKAARMAFLKGSDFADEMTILTWELKKLEAYEKGEGE